MGQANAARFDGSSAYMARGADLTGLSDGQQFTASFWIRRNTISTDQRVYCSSSDNSRIYLPASNNTVAVRFEATGAQAILYRSSALTDTIDWHHVLFSFDQSSAALRHLYIDDVDDLATVVTYDTGPSSLDFQQSDHYIGCVDDTSFFLDADIAEVWIDFNRYVDFSVESNRRKFVTADLKAVNLGANGETPFGSSPFMYFANPYTSFQTNLGTGGGFTEHGTIGDGSPGPDFSGAPGFPPALFPTAQMRSPLLRM